MPTVEERLAALETKLAALTDTTPTTYYEHQYSGEEIDAAVGRALTGGALDTSVTNVSNQLGTFTRPNLLDNWYFGNPVDQRGGYIVPKGVNYSKVDGFVPQGPIPETVRVDYIDEAGSARFNYGGVACYVPKDGGYVRGYTGNEYTVDRWKLTYRNGQISIKDGYASLLGSGMNFSQILDENVYKPLRGKTVTLSIIGRGDCQIVSEDAPSSYHAAFINSDVFTLASFSFLTKSDSDRFVFHIKPNTSNPVDILAAKLEIGSTQTLAHKENGVWVPNEVPEYGDQLRRCQRYCRPIPHHLDVCAVNGTYYAHTLESFEEMRSAPVSLTNLIGKNVTNMTDNNVATITNVYTWNKHGGVAIQLSQNPNTDIVFLDSMNYLISADL